MSGFKTMIIHIAGKYGCSFNKRATFFIKKLNILSIHML